MANAPKKKPMIQEVLDEIRKTIFNSSSSDATPAPVRPIAPPKGLMKSVDERNNATKEAEKAADGYKKGGIVSKTGKALVHKGELVLPKKLAGKVQKMVKKPGGKTGGSK